MKFGTTAVTALAILPHTLATPVDSEDALARRQPEFSERAEAIFDRDVLSVEEELGTSDLEKRRGGGGGGGRGGGSSSSGGSSGRAGSSGSSSGGSPSGASSGSSRGGSSSSTGSSGTSGGLSGGSRGGSGSSGSSGTTRATPGYGGGKFYGGGGRTAYSAGSRSPSGIVPFAVGGAALGFAAFALWTYPVYAYPWGTTYAYRNRTNRTGTIQTRQDDGVVNLPVTCLCDQELPCSCDDNGNSTYFDEFFGPNNQTKQPLVATIQNVNGTNKVVLNGTLPDDGDDDSSSSSSSGTTSAAGMVTLQAGSYAMMSAGFVASLWLL